MFFQINYSFIFKPTNLRKEPISHWTQLSKCRVARYVCSFWRVTNALFEQGQVIPPTFYACVYVMQCEKLIDCEPDRLEFGCFARYLPRCGFRFAQERWKGSHDNNPSTTRALLHWRVRSSEYQSIPVAVPALLTRICLLRWNTSEPQNIPLRLNVCDLQNTSLVRDWLPLNMMIIIKNQTRKIKMT